MIRPATETDAVYLAPRLRKEDVAELKAASGSNPLEGLMTGLRKSDYCYAMCGKAGEVFCMGGWMDIPVTEQTPYRSALVWLLASDEIGSHFLLFQHHIKQWFQRMWSSGYELLFNVVDARNTVHCRWLHHLGATLHAAQPCGQERLPFHMFTFTNFKQENANV